MWRKFHLNKKYKIRLYHLYRNEYFKIIHADYKVGRVFPMAIWSEFRLPSRRRPPLYRWFEIRDSELLIILIKAFGEDEIQSIERLIQGIE